MVEARGGTGLAVLDNTGIDLLSGGTVSDPKDQRIRELELLLWRVFGIAVEGTDDELCRCCNQNRKLLKSVLTHSEHRPENGPKLVHEIDGDD